MTLDLSATSQIIELEIYEADLSLAPHTINVRNALICGAIEPIAGQSRVCKKRKEILSDFSGEVKINGSAHLRFMLSKIKSQVLLLSLIHI